MLTVGVAGGFACVVNGGAREGRWVSQAPLNNSCMCPEPAVSGERWLPRGPAGAGQGSPSSSGSAPQREAFAWGLAPTQVSCKDPTPLAGPAYTLTSRSRTTKGQNTSLGVPSEHKATDLQIGAGVGVDPRIRATKQCQLEEQTNSVD